MKKKTLVIIFSVVILILGYLYYSNKKIDGIYIKDYNLESFMSEQYVVKIKNQKFHKYHFGSKGEPNVTDYFSFNNIVKFSTNTESEKEFFLPNYKIESIDENKVVFKTLLFDSEKIVYLRVPKYLKSNNKVKFDLIGKTFELKAETSSDTIYFNNKYLILKNNIETVETDGKWSTRGWEYYIVDEFHFIKTGDGWLFIVKEENNELFFHNLTGEKGNRKLELNEIEIDFDFEKYINNIK